MKKAILVAASLAALTAGCSTLGGLEPIEVPAEAFRPIERANDAFASERWVIDHYLRLDGRGSEAVESRIGTDPYGRADRVLLFWTDGYEDDSVRGEQWRIELDDSDIGYLVIGAGKRNRCWRGPNAGEWTRELCP